MTGPKGYYIGIDAGGSTFRAAILDARGHLVDQIQVGVNMNLLSSDPESFFQSVKGLFIQYPQALGISIGMAGTGGTTQRTGLQKLVRGLFGSTVPLEIRTDAHAALFANFQHQPGILLICGTGSIVLGQDAHGEQLRSGGWGYLLGDEGGGFWLVKQVFLEYLAYCDGLSEHRPFFEQLEADLGKQPREIVTRFYQGSSRNDLSALSQKWLGSDDPWVWSIAQQGIETCVQRVVVVFQKLRLPVLRVAYTGGMFHNPRFSSLFLDMLRERVPGAQAFPGVTNVSLFLARAMLQKVEKGSIVGEDLP
ncbi:MAG TPA: BadF/BadG/BcrA/BcrD ATPase family protein [Thermotogota bacterium]|nr:BadF/BadG/BcrA/BcrD ATPase family protein [Thermotogota bacterium]HRW93175.1 BadF/BadG/BcrA/BcrD ATPase family protein [Thermotogota bacterium]